MTGYYISNTFRFFANGESYISDLLEMVKLYDNDESLEEQVEIIFCLFSTEILERIAILRGVPSEYTDWCDILNIIDEWLAAWLTIAQVDATRAKLCRNPIIRSFVTIIS